MSATPRTDAACGMPGDNWELVANRLCDLSIRLETELNEANKRLDWLATEYGLKWAYWQLEDNQGGTLSRKEIDEAMSVKP